MDILFLKNNEKGFVLITSLLILMILMVIGIAATNTTIIELKIAGNDRVHKTTFYQADAGTQVGSRLVELVIAGVSVDPITVHDSDFLFDDPRPDRAAPDASFVPGSPDAGTTELFIGGGTAILAPGWGLQMVAGHEGKGRGAAVGGVHVLYDIYSRHRGWNNSESIVQIRWNHVTQ